MPRMKVVDLSKPIRYNAGDPVFMRVKIRHKPHWQARWLVRALGLPFRLMPKDFVGWADDTITRMGVHSTTHIDAPWHYGPLAAGRRAATVDEIPLEQCSAPRKSANVAINVMGSNGETSRPSWM
jgi:kynurenine formamidase